MLMSEQDTTNPPGEPTPPAQPAEPVPPSPAPTPAQAAPPPPVQAAPPPPAVAWQTPAADAGPAPGIEFAPHGARLVAYIVDGIIITVVLTVITVIAFVVLGAGIRFEPGTNQIDPDSISSGQWLVFVILFLVASVIALLYFPFFWVRSGQTPGMRPFDLRVVRDRDGAPIGWGTALLRLVGLWVAGAVFYLGYIWIFIDKRHRGWQDLIAGTVMIKRP
jgi:uncharacterized RDD family membrane protein YckC